MRGGPPLSLTLCWCFRVEDPSLRDFSPSALYIRASPASPGHKEMNARKFLVFTDLFDVDVSNETPTDGDQEVTEKTKLERKDIKDKYCKDKSS